MTPKIGFNFISCRKTITKDAQLYLNEKVLSESELSLNVICCRLLSLGKIDIFVKQARHILNRFVSGFGFYKRQISKRSTSGYRTFRALVEYSFVLLSLSSARTINIKTSKKACLTSCQHHELHCLADVIFYRRLTVFQCYLSAIIHELNNSLCNWFPPL